MPPYPALSLSRRCNSPQNRAHAREAQAAPVKARQARAKVCQTPVQAVDPSDHKGYHWQGSQR
eukprot:9319945-Prorocentrum_lima.AAC.1